MPLKPLDFGDPNPFSGFFGEKKHLAWPVNAYFVTLPRSVEDDLDLNPFERVILNLLNLVGRMDVVELSRETCIPDELVRFILLRLQDRALIDEHNIICKQTFSLLNSEHDNNLTFVTALLFRERATGMILPYLHLLGDNNPIRKREDWENEQRKKKEDVYEVSSGRSKLVPLSNRDVISALRATIKRSAFGGYHKTPDSVQIHINESPEEYYLDCPIAIQKKDSEFRIADPFGFGFSHTLESAFFSLLEHNQKLGKWLSDWKSKLHNSDHSHQKRQPAPFETQVNYQRYPLLIDNLRTDNKFRNLRQIYASIEWALFYACSRHQHLDTVLCILKVEDRSNHPKLLANAVRSLGVDSPMPFWSIPNGKLIDFQNDKAELETVLAIAILQAEKDMWHPLHRAIAFMRSENDCGKHSDQKHPLTLLVGRLFDIKHKRNNKAHGKGRVDAPESQLPDDSFMQMFVHSLLPEIQFDNTLCAVQDFEVSSDSRLDALANLQVQFTFKIFNNLETDVSGRLIEAERFWLNIRDSVGNERIDACDFAVHLAAALQASFRQCLFGKLPPDVMDHELIATAHKNAKEAILCHADLPDCLSTVKLRAIRETMLGSDQSLGSCVVAFLLMSGPDTLHDVALRQPSFIDDVSEVIRQRGHGNKLKLSKRGKDSIESLRRACYDTITTLFEVNHELL